MRSVDKAEIENFERVSDSWWDEDGPFKPLHKLSPTRMAYLREQIDAHYNLPSDHLKPYTKLNILDIGCGGGLVCEPLARLGAKITGLDASSKNIETAISHASLSQLDIQYFPTTAEEWAEKGKTYDVVLALEIIEHVADPAFFIETCTKLLKPNGLIIFSTLNRTGKSFALGIVAAEYILKWLPQGTHNWKKFVKPSELAKSLRQLDFKVIDVTGMTYNPLSDQFSLSNNDIDVNYFISASHNT